MHHPRLKILLNISLFLLLWIAIIVGSPLLPKLFNAINRSITQINLNTIDRIGIILGFLMATGSIALAIFTWINKAKISSKFKTWLSKRNFEHSGQPFQVAPENFQVAIIPVSRKQQPAYILNHLKPQYVSFLYTEKSKTVALELIREFSEPPYSVSFWPDTGGMQNEKYMIDQPDQPESTKEIADLFIEHYLSQGFSRNKIYVDTTGGKVPMSIGAFQAAEEAAVSSFYVIARGKDDKIIKPEKPEQGEPVFLSDHTKTQNA